MNIFEKFNTKSVCKICGTKKKGRSVLIPIEGTENNDNIECEQVHLDCLDPIFMSDHDNYFIVQTFPKNRT